MNATQDQSPASINNSTNSIWKAKVTLGNHIILSLLMMLTLSGNLLTLAAFLKFKKLRIRRYLLIASLAVADALVGVSWGAFLLTSLLPRQCSSALSVILTQMAITISTTASFLHVLLMAMDRFVAVTFPFKHSEYMSTRRLLAMVTTVWIAGFAWALAPLSWILEHKGKFGDCDYLPSPNPYFGTVGAITYLLTVIVVIANYTSIWRAAKRQKVRINIVSHIGEDSSDIREKLPDASQAAPSKATKFISVVIGAYLGIWLPFFVLSVTITIAPDLQHLDAMYVLFEIMFFLMLSNSCINVFVYAAYIKDFRYAFHTLLCCKARA